MILSKDNIDIILAYSAFASYSDEQKQTLRTTLENTQLNRDQLEILFGGEVMGGMIHNLVEDSKSADQANSQKAATQLGKILANIEESLNPEWGIGLTPIIKNMLGRLGPYLEIVADVIELTRNHIEILGGRIVEPQATQAEASESNSHAEPPFGHFLFFPMVERPPIQQRAPNRVRDYSREGQAQRHEDYRARLRDSHAAALAEPQIGLQLWHDDQSSEDKLESLNARIIRTPNDLDARQQRIELLGDHPVALVDCNYILDYLPNAIAIRLVRAAWCSEQYIRGGVVDTEHEYFRMAQADYQFVLEREPGNTVADQGIRRLEEDRGQHFQP